jgi:hypothetical protein
MGLRRRSLEAAWGDLRYGVLMSLTRSTALRLRGLPVDPRNWRPHILLFSGDLSKRLDLVRFAAWLNQGRGILTVCHLEVGSVDEAASKAQQIEREMNQQLRGERLSAFAQVEIVPDLESGALAVAQSNGIAGIESNTIMFGWSGKRDRLESQLRVIRQAALLGKSAVICRIAPRRWISRLRDIYVWWGGLQNNGDMMLLFAYLVSLNPEWSGARVTVLSIESEKLGAEDVEDELAELVERSRISAETEVISLKGMPSVQETIRERSSAADLVFLGLQTPSAGAEDAHARRLDELVDGLPTCVLVHAAGPFAGRLLDQ